MSFGVDKVVTESKSIVGLKPPGQETLPQGPKLPVRTSADGAKENGRRVRNYQRSHRSRVVANNTK